MKAFVVSLERSRDRRSHVLNELSKVGIDYEIIDAVDGDLLEPSWVGRASSTWLGPKEFTRGILGCSMSHVNARSAVLSAGLDAAIILEDDVVLPATLKAVAEEAARHMDRSEVVLIQMGCNVPPCELSRQGAVALSSGHMMHYPMDLQNVCCTGAYLITAEACQRMDSSDLPTRASADHWALFHKDGILDRVRCVAPLPVTIDPKFDSTIRHARESWRDYVYNGLDRVPFPPAHALMALRRRRFLRRWASVRLVDDPSPYCL